MKGKANMAVPQKIKQNYHATQQSHIRVCADPRELRAGSGTGARTPVFKAALLPAAERWNRPKRPSTENGRTTWSIQTVGCVIQP